MWICHRGGFLSCVEDENDPGRILVRGRVFEHVEGFCRIAGIDPGEVFEDGSADYPFRVFIGRDAFVDGVAAVAGRVDYPNFKSAVGKGEAAGRGYLSFLHRVWNIGVAEMGAARTRTRKRGAPWLL